MAINDIKVLRGAGTAMSFLTQDRTSSSQTTNYLPGEPLKVSGNYVIALATGDPEQATDELVGLCAATSTETGTADGAVTVTTIVPGVTVWRGKATTAGNMDTATELAGLINDWISMDVTGAGTNGSTGVFTFDENEGTDPNQQAFRVIDGDITAGTLDCAIHALATTNAPITGQTID